MLATLASLSPEALSARLIQVEVFVTPGMPKFTIVGLADVGIQEAKERVRSAIKNSGAEFPLRRVTVNLAPAELRKSGSLFDFPIALGIMAAYREQISLEKLHGCVCLGELSLDGGLKPVRGVLPLAMMAREQGISRIFLPRENAQEAALIGGLEVVPVDSLRQMIDFLRGGCTLAPAESVLGIHESDPLQLSDLASIRGQEFAKRALEISAAGGHNLLLCGSPGSGKTMLARTMPSILPEMDFNESLAVTKIYSYAGLLSPDRPLMKYRPFRSVHHTASAVSIVGGGKIPMPGEITLAHMGVLFLDEMPEFPSAVLEVLRQPMEDRHITISRANGTITFPAHFTLVAAMNPCPCGYYQVPHARKPCSCSPSSIRNYQKRISGPLMDRIDLYCNVSPLKFEKLATENASESSQDVCARVIRARELQRSRHSSTFPILNSEMTPQQLKQCLFLERDSVVLLRQAVDRFHLSARGYYKILKIARTIADLESSQAVSSGHIAEALQYRRKED